MTILCGAPIGRTIQPTFAAMVCRLTVNMTKSILSTLINANMLNGTKIINETSFVMNIELKKQVKTKNNTRARVFFTLSNSLRTNISKTDRFFRISTKTIMTKRSVIVSQLM